ncbi:inactive protein RESTRICTED TEV MOVEMENT 2 [Quercus suber]|uniref:Inactive protein restricted tev movement 2 n=1 Tax=Quercus suber TaxID=58331 RepID=A0AAW0J8V3_QUESU|nr:inactive protein RESTRICTED TEV MOVEMENT 2-like [Quercus suber]POE58596.1 inactive protein restricted tev movement 2 [Quercus suber]
MAMENVRRRGIGGRAPSRDHIVEEFVPYSGWTEDVNGRYLLIDLPDFKKEEVKLSIDGSGNMTATGQRQVNEDKMVHFDQSFKLPENSDVDKISGRFDGEILYVTVPKLAVEEKREHETLKENVSDKAKQIEHEKPINDESLNRDDHHHQHHRDKPGNIHGHDSETEKRSNTGNIHGHVSETEKRSSRNAPMCFSKETIEGWENESGLLGSAVKMLKRNKGIVVAAVLAFSLGVLVTRKLESPGY